MAENESIQKMAEHASAEIFSVFGWERLSLMNRDWPCVEQQKHRKPKGKKSHPTDVVFQYLDPYSGEDVYVQSDLKSYAKSSLEVTDFTKTLRELAFATECADKSPEFKKLYVDQNRSHDVIGMLFVYNHDGGYEDSFEDELAAIPPSKLEIEPGVFVGVVSPKRVIYLNSIAKEIKSLHSDGLLPSANHRWFFFPHLARSGAAHAQSKCCSLQALLSPMFLLGYEFPSNAAAPRGEAARLWHKRGYFVFYDGMGASIHEFKYLLDYFFVYQLDVGHTHISLNLYDCDPDAAAIFERAKREFALDYWPIGNTNQSEFSAVLDNITFRRVQTNVPRFDPTVLGMVRDIKV